MLPAEQPTSPDPLLWAARETCRNLGGISLVSLWRRMTTDPDFPKPVKIAGRNYFRPPEIGEYIERQAERAVA